MLLIAGPRFHYNVSSLTSSGLRVFVLALAASMSELLMLGVILCIFIIIFSSLIYYAELDTKNGFRSIPECFWWAVITMTTVGYGDVYPTTNAGYFVGAMCGVFGMLATGLPIPIIATNFQVSLTRCDRNKMAAILQTALLNAFSWNAPLDVNALNTHRYSMECNGRYRDQYPRQYHLILGK